MLDYMADQAILKIENPSRKIYFSNQIDNFLLLNVGYIECMIFDTMLPCSIIEVNDNKKSASLFKIYHFL
jgi:hypothetical protein